MDQQARRKYILRATLAYTILASAWILLSDLLLISFAEIPAIQWLSAVKGIFFVVVTTFLLFVALRGVPGVPGSSAACSPDPLSPDARRSKVWPYLFALAATLGMLLVRDGLAVSFQNRPLLILIIFPVILSAMAGGCGPGLTATLLAALGINYFAIPPLHSLMIDAPHDFFQWSFLIANGVLISILSELLHRQRHQAEASRRLQAVTMASIGDGVIATDTGGKITYLNPEAEKLTGWSAGAAQGKPLAEVFRIISEDTRQRLADPVAQVLLSGETTGSANHALLLSRDGQELPIQESCAPIRLTDGTLLGATLVFRDDTQRRRAESKVQEERALYQDLVNAQPAGIYRIRVKAGKHWAHDTLNTAADLPYDLEIASDRVCEILDVSCRALQDDPGLISRGIHPEDEENFIQANEEANARLEPFNWEGRFLQDGRIQWLQFQSLPRRLDNGDIIWTGILTDISARKKAEEALRKSQEQLTLLARLLGQSSQPFGQGFPDGRLGFHNQAFLDLIGYSEEELPNLDWGRDLTPPEWLGRERESLSQLHETGRPVRYEKEYIRKDHSRVPVELLVHLAPDEEGRPLYYYSFITDLRARKKAEEALRESENTYRSLFDHMLNGLAYCRMLFSDDYPEDFIYLTVNEAFGKLTGLWNVEGRKVSEVIPGIRQADPELFERYGRVARGGPPERFEIYVAALRMWFWISVYSPKPEHFVAVFDVITDRKKAELALKEREEQLRAISDNLPDTYLYQTAQGTNGRSKFLFVSGGVTRIHGVTSEEVLRDPRVLYKQVDQTQLQELIQAEKNSLTTLKDFTIELHMRRPDGKWRWLLIRSRPRRKPDGSMVWDGAATDITSQKTLEKQLAQAQKMESVGRLAGGVAHDFNNILTVISGHTELALEQSQPGESIYQDLLEIQSAASRSANLTRQLLAFARKQTVCPVLLDLNDTVGSMLKMLQRLIGEDIELAWLPGHDLWPVRIDPSQVDQILANLAVNARDAITGVGQLTIETANVDLDEEYCANHLGFVRGQYVQLEVSDNGCGMDSKILAHIFEPFFTTKEEGQGTGLGLATVYGIVKQNQGFINVYSEPGQGTTIRIYLPRVKMEVMGTRPETSREEPPRGAETILIVEDDPAILDIGKRFIERLGYKVLTAASPNLALKLVEEFTGTIDLLITDVVMPDMNGKELARLLQEMKPGIKCLFMSGYTADAIARQGILDEGICFLPKPFSSREIALKIREALKQPE